MQINTALQFSLLDFSSNRVNIIAHQSMG